MSFAEIEAELKNLAPDELRNLAVKSWLAFLEKEEKPDGFNECDERDAALLKSLDEAASEADATHGQGHSSADVLAQLCKWTSK
jgi:hypothetical protein